MKVGILWIVIAHTRLLMCEKGTNILGIWGKIREILRLDGRELFTFGGHFVAPNIYITTCYGFPPNSHYFSTLFANAESHVKQSF